MQFIISYLLPVAYTVLLGWLLQRNRFLLANGFTGRFIILFFIGKCISGIVYCYMAIKYIPNADIPMFYADGLDLYKLFIKSPTAFWQQFRQPFQMGSVSLTNTRSGFLRSVFEGIKFIHFVLDFFSLGNIYTNMILFNGLAAWVFLRCWAFFKNYLGSGVAGVWFFLLPSAFFYTSNMLKEGIECILIAALLPLAYKLYKSFSVFRLVGALVLFALLFFFKFLIAVTFLGVLFLWWALSVFPTRRWLVVGATVVATVAVFFLMGHIKPALNLPKYLVDRQQEFLELEANSKTKVAILEPTFTSFAKALPTALNNVLFKPFPGEGGKAMYLLFSVEIICFWLFILFLFAKNRFRAKLGHIPPLVCGLFVFSIANLAIIGYTIPNIGAITRYRSIFLPAVGLFCWWAFNGQRTWDSFKINTKGRIRNGKS